MTYDGAYSVPDPRAAEAWRDKSHPISPTTDDLLYHKAFVNRKTAIASNPQARQLWRRVSFDDAIATAARSAF
jgi:hypothetical protein